jgi:hypothetical protein
MTRCTKCNKEIDSGVWAAHKIIPKQDYAFCGRCWYYDKNPDISYNGNIEDPRDKRYRHYRSRFHDKQDEPFVIPMTPIIYRNGEVTRLTFHLKKPTEDNLELLGIVAETLGNEIK